MDFHLSYEWLREFVDTRLPPEELAGILSLHAVSVERMRRMDEGLDPSVVVARVETIETHPNADKLKVVTVNATPSGSPSRRGGGKSIRVVCGGINLREGMLVAFAPVGARVRWHGEGELVELKPAEIRGVRSEGMICAASEIGLGEYFAGGEREILDLSDTFQEPNSPPEADAPLAHKFQVGKSVSEVLDLDDVILDCEITTNRPDLMSVQGLAREVAVITGARMRVVGAGPRPRPRVGLAVPFGGRPRGAAPTELHVRIEDSKRCPYYSATFVGGVTVAPSPWWMQRRLLAGGIRPISNVVDVTNYVLLEMGQPLHAFDASKLQADSRKPQAKTIIIRNAKMGENIAALDGETHALTPEYLVIADAERPVAIAGVIGGSESAVGPQTTSVVLEAATFNPATVRKAWRSLDIRTESAIQYEKGVQPESVIAARDRALALLAKVAGAQVIGKPVIAGRMPKPSKPIAFDFSEAQRMIGVAVAPAKAKKALTALGCVVRSSPSSSFGVRRSAEGGAREGAAWNVTPPWWRRGDLEASHDFTEEIARLHGYHNLPSVLPVGTLPIASMLSQQTRKHSNILENVRMSVVHTAFDWEDRCRDALADLGATEVFPFSLTSREHVARCGFTTEQCVALENPLSEDLALLRPSLLPTLLPIIAQNQGEVPSAIIFEMGNIYISRRGGAASPPAKGKAVPPANGRPQGAAPTTEGLPREEMRLCLAAYGRLMAGGHVEKVKGMIEHLFATLGIRDATFRSSVQCTSPPAGLSDPNPSTLTPQPSCLWHPGRTMDVVVSGVLIGVIGEVHPLVVEKFGIEQRVAVADLDWAALLPHLHATRAPTPPPAHPAIKRDLAIVVDRTTPYADVAAVLDAADPLLVGYDLFDTYEDATGTSVPLGKKSLAFHLTYRHDHRTLTTPEADAAHTHITTTLTTRFGATVRE